MHLYIFLSGFRNKMFSGSVSNDVVVIGANHHNTLGVIRSLGRKGIHPYVILVTCLKRPFTGYSKYIKEKCIVESGDKVMSVLRSKFYNRSLKPIIIACSDEASGLVDDNKEELRKHFYVPGNIGDKPLTYWMNKQKMSELGERIGFNIPKSCVVNSSNYNIESIEYPCITKPIVSKDGSKTEITVCKNKEELEKFLESQNNITIQIQKFVEKDYEYQLIGCSLNSGKEVIIPGVSRIINSPQCTNTGFLHYENLNASYDLEHCKRFIQEIGYSGLFSLEFLRGKDGKDYFMEMNFRNDGNSICVTDSGVNLSYIWYLYNAGLDYKTEVISPIKEIYVLPEFVEVYQTIFRKIKMKECIRDFKLADTFMDYDKDDKVPFFHGILDYIANGFILVFMHKMRR